MRTFTVSRYGSDALQPTDVPTPSVGARDVLVDVRAASINPLDKMVRNGEFKRLLKYMQFISVGGPNLEKSLTVLKPGGHAISVVGPPEPTFAKQLGQPMLAPVMAVRSRKVRKQAKKLGVRYAFLFMRAGGAQLKTLAGLYGDGTLRPALERTFDFDQTVRAMAHIEQGKTNGKIVATR